jgi:hypothetical protein
MQPVSQNLKERCDLFGSEISNLDLTLLTNRQREVAELRKAGLGFTMIGFRLGISAERARQIAARLLSRARLKDRSTRTLTNHSDLKNRPTTANRLRDSEVNVQLSGGCVLAPSRILRSPLRVDTTRLTIRAGARHGDVLRAQDLLDSPQLSRTVPRQASSLKPPTLDSLHFQNRTKALKSETPPSNDKLKEYSDF